MCRHLKKVENHCPKKRLGQIVTWHLPIFNKLIFLFRTPFLRVKSQFDIKFRSVEKYETCLLLILKNPIKYECSLFTTITIRPKRDLKGGRVVSSQLYHRTATWNNIAFYYYEFYHRKIGINMCYYICPSITTNIKGKESWNIGWNIGWNISWNISGNTSEN